MKLLKLSKYGDTSWSMTKDYATATVEEFNEANLRDMYDDEIVLDCESPFEAHKVGKQLDKENVGYTYWKTGSRGGHYHIRIKGLEVLDNLQRKLYRKHWINKYNTDIAKQSGFIAMEWKPHFKTGNQKVLIKENNISNSIDMDLVVEIKQKIGKVRNKLTSLKPDPSRKENIKRKVKPSDLLRWYGIDTTTQPCDTPFGGSVRKKCFSFNDNKGLWYDFHHCLGGDIFTLVMEKESCNFLEAMEWLDNKFVTK